MEENTNEVSEVSHNVCSANYHVSIKKYDTCGNRFYYIDSSLLSDLPFYPLVRVVREFGGGVYSILEGRAITLCCNGPRREVHLKNEDGSLVRSSRFNKLYRVYER